MVNTMNNTTEKTYKVTKYVVYEDTFENTYKKRCDVEADRIVYEFVSPRKLTVEQEVVAARQPYRVDRRHTIHFYWGSIEELAGEKLSQVIVDGEGTDVVRETLTRILASPVKIVIELGEKGFDRLSAEGELDCVMRSLTFYGQDIEYSYSDDVGELEQRLSRRDEEIYFGKDEHGFVPLRSLKIDLGTYHGGYEQMHSDLLKCIKKLLRKDYTYCIRNGKVVVPQEYRDKGAAGIAEWRKIKIAGNKMNNMENTILKESVGNRKIYARRCAKTMLYEIAGSTRSYKVPRLTVKGTCNRGKLDKHVSELLQGKTKNDIMKMQDEEILNMAKDFWKKELQDAIDRIDAITGADVVKY